MTPETSSTETSSSPPPAPAPAPAPETSNPRTFRPVESATPPAPELPRRPRTRKAPPPPSQLAMQAPAAPTPSTSKRELPTDPDQLRAVRGGVAPTVELLLGMLDVAAQSLPPRKPLSDMERAVLTDPVADVVYVYLGGQMDPLAALGMALAGIAMMRWMEWKKESGAAGAGDEP